MSQSVHLLQYTDASFSISTDEEFIDEIVFASTDLGKVYDYIQDNDITLGKEHLYDSNYQYYTVVTVELQ